MTTMRTASGAGANNRIGLDRTSLLELYDHMSWADAEVWGAVLGCEAAADDATIRDLLRHAHVAQRVYLRLWRGEVTDATLPQLLTLPALFAWGRAFYGEARAFVEAQTDATSLESMPNAWLRRLEGFLGPPAGVVTVGGTMVQVPLHSQHHRAQVCTRLRELACTPPVIDYVAWVWRGRPHAAWGE